MAGRLDHDDCLGLRGATAMVATVAVAGVTGTGVAGGNIAGAGAADRAPSVGWRPGHQTVHKAGNMLELVTNGSGYRLTQVTTIVIRWRPRTAAVTSSVVPLVRTAPLQQEEQEEEEECEIVRRLGCHLTPDLNLTGRQHRADWWSQ